MQRVCYFGNVWLSMSLFSFSLKGPEWFKFCISVLYWYESYSESRRLCFWVSHFRMKFLIWHLSLAKPRGLGGKQKAKRKKKNPASVRRCLFPWWCGACACVYDDLTHAYSPPPASSFCQDADSVSASTRHMVQSHVRLRFPGGLCVRNVRNPQEKVKFTI